MIYEQALSVIDIVKIPRIGYNNCQRCAAALELSYRHIKFPKIQNCFSPFQNVFDTMYQKPFYYKNYYLCDNIKEVPIPVNRAKDFIKAYCKPLDSRYMVNISFKNGSGHVFNLVNEDYDVYVCDATVQKYWPLEDSDYFNDISKASLFRIDNKSISNTDIITKIFTDKYRYQFDSTDGKKYYSIMDGLKEIGEKNRTYDIIENSKYIGKIKCLGRTNEYYHWLNAYVWKYEWV